MKMTALELQITSQLKKKKRRRKFQIKFHYSFQFCFFLIDISIYAKMKFCPCFSNFKQQLANKRINSNQNSQFKQLNILQRQNHFAHEPVYLLNCRSVQNELNQQSTYIDVDKLRNKCVAIHIDGQCGRGSANTGWGSSIPHAKSHNVLIHILILHY